jgi:glutamate/aspartate transport system permease protein
MNHMNFSAITSNLSYLMIDGFSLTIKLTVLCALTVFVLGTVFAVVRLYGPQWAQTLVASYVNLVRSIPLILVIFWVYFLSPYVVAWVVGSANPVQVGMHTHRPS